MKRWVMLGMAAAGLAAASAGRAQQPASGEAPAPPPPAAAEKPSVPRVEEPAPPYDASGLRDPFRPFTLDMRDLSAPDSVATPLQRYDLGQLRLVGTLGEISPPRALIQDSLGMGYIVTIGTPVGRNTGVVKSIQAGRVVVEERLLDFYGQEQLSEVVMELPSDPVKNPGLGGRQ